MQAVRQASGVAIKTPISYYGGKQSMLPLILTKVPPHRVYTEPFAGGAAVFWAKRPSKLEVLNDLNGEVVNFYQVLRQDFEALNRLVQATLHSRQSYADALCVYHHPHLFSQSRRAWAFWVLTQQGYCCKVGSWGYDKTTGQQGAKAASSKSTI